jgi:hypothetical protein
MVNGRLIAPACRLRCKASRWFLGSSCARLTRASVPTCGSTTRHAGLIPPDVHMDCRIKSGNDEVVEGDTQPLRS